MEFTFCLNGHCPIWEAWAAIATFLAVLVALFGDTLRHRFLKPKLTLRMQRGDSPPGVHTDRKHAHYFHLVMRNESRLATARNVRVILTDVFAKSDSEWELLGSPTIQTQWKHHATLPPAVTIAPNCKMYADAFYIGEGVGESIINIHPVAMPHNLAEKILHQRKIALVFQPVCDELQAQKTRFEIEWSGEFFENRQDQLGRLTVRSVILDKDAKPAKDAESLIDEQIAGEAPE